MGERQFRFVDLFAGIGGFHHALGGIGGDCVLAVELDPEAQQTYRSSFPHTRLDRDIRTLTMRGDRAASKQEIRKLVPAHDVLCAGFPCQPFSKSGAQEGVRDRTRGTLFHDVMAIVAARRPRYVILENVRNLAGPNHVDTWDTIIRSLWAEGYRVSYEPVIASPHLLPRGQGGAPQVRDRVFVLATRVSGPTTRELDEPPLVTRAPLDGWDPKRWSVADDILLDGVEPAGFGLRPEEEGWLEAWQAFVQGIDGDWLPGFPIWVDAFAYHCAIPHGTPRWKEDFLRKNSAFYNDHARFIDDWLERTWGPLGQRVADFPPSRRKFEWQARSAQPLQRDRDLESLVAHLRPSGIRVKPATYLPALVAITQTSVIGPKVTGTVWRRLIPAEAARLQGIHDVNLFENAGVSDKAAYKQLGNAVNVGVARYLADLLFEHGNAPWRAPRSSHLRPAGSLAIA